MENARIESSLARFGERFLKRVFVDGEIAYCSSMKFPARHFAARFAAKEAGAKSLGTGISRGVSWKEFEVQRAVSGQPSLHLSGRAAELAEALGVRRVQLSLTHSRELALAVVVAED